MLDCMPGARLRGGLQQIRLDHRAQLFPFDAGLPTRFEFLRHVLVQRQHPGIVFAEVESEVLLDKEDQPSQARFPCERDLQRPSEQLRHIKGAYIHQNLLSPSAWMPARVRWASRP